MREALAQVSTPFGSRLKRFIPSWRSISRIDRSDNPAWIDQRMLVTFFLIFSMLIAAWTFGIHALQGQSPSLGYSLAIGLSISASYTTSIFILTRTNWKSTSFWKSILLDFIIFHMSSALMLTLTFAIVRNILPYGSPSSLWPGLFIRQAPISVTLFAACYALTRKVGAKRRIKPRSTELSLADATLLEAQGNYVRVTTAAGSRMIRMTLAMAEQSLPMEHFCRIHRSRIVRRDQIERVDWLDATVRLTTGETVKSSSTGLANLRAILS